MFKTLIIFILTLLSISLNAQVNVIEIDTSIQSITINNYGTLIENNGGTVNVENVSDSITESNSYESHENSSAGMESDSFTPLLIVSIFVILGVFVWINGYKDDSSHWSHGPEY